MTCLQLANQIIDKFEENNGQKYIFSVSMQNHMPYINKQYENYDVEISGENLNDSEKLEFKNYVQGIYDSDQMFIKIVNYLKNIQEPTILVMFGDHLPALNSIYEKSEYQGVDYYTTPYVVWANYDIEYESLDLFDYMSPSNLSINIMRLSKIEVPWYLKKFEELYKIYPVINNQFIITNDRKILSVDKISNYDLIKDCRILQYDLLIKKKYISVK